MTSPVSLARLLDAGRVIRVELVEVLGSSPRDAGAVMYVGAEACLGTIGGGQLEYMAIDQARAMLASGAELDEMNVPLGPEIGQCCGGRVRVLLRLVGDAPSEYAALEQAKNGQPQVFIFGAGHVGRAVAQALAPLPCAALLVDSRAQELKLAADLPQIQTPLPETLIRSATAGSAFIILTHDHALDFLLGVEALARGDAAYIGMIGSATKAARFATYARAQGQDPAGLICPMGRKTASKDPAVIAAMIIAEVWPALEHHIAKALT